MAVKKIRKLSPNIFATRKVTSSIHDYRLNSLLWQWIYYAGMPTKQKNIGMAQC